MRNIPPKYLSMGVDIRKLFIVFNCADDDACISKIGLLRSLISIAASSTIIPACSDLFLREYIWAESIVNSIFFTLASGQVSA